MAEVAIAAEAADSTDTRALLTAYEAELVSWGVVLNHGSAGGTSPSDFAAPRGAWLVARSGSAAVGCGGVRLLDARVAELKRMYVDPSARGAGLARRLVTELEAHARSLGAQVVRLDTGRDMTPAIALYRSCGYVEIDDYNGNPDAGWWFEKQLA